MTTLRLTLPTPPIDSNPVDFFNYHATWLDAFNFHPDVSFKENKLSINKIEIPVHNGSITLKEPFLKLLPQVQYTKFSAFCKLHFKGDHNAAMHFLEYYHMGKEIPYIRVGTDYFKIISKADQFGISRNIIKSWKKEEIKQDHGPGFFSVIPKYDDFCIQPDNYNHQPVVNNCYNLYAPFPHTPSAGIPSEDLIPATMKMLKHIFGSQLHLGLIYMKVLVEMPRQKLPILCLLSKKRDTGKTTVLNWFSMLFGDNYIQINPEDLNIPFNSGYATKNIIALDETIIEKSHAVEKLKSISTGKNISVNQKHISNYSLPFFAKIIICSNRENDFIRVEKEESRFWPRKIPLITDKNIFIETALRDEIPYFLSFLASQPPVVIKSRTVFLDEETHNEHLDTIKEESLSWLHKELLGQLEDFFNANPSIPEFYASTSDLIKHWFAKNNKVERGYLNKVLRDEMGVVLSENPIWYTPFGKEEQKTKNRAWVFKIDQFLNYEPLPDEEIPY